MQPRWSSQGRPNPNADAQRLAHTDIINSVRQAKGAIIARRLRASGRLLSQGTRVPSQRLTSS
ncbi:hypothetical protein XHV734_2978 [Xanthomonas hortorum pv. vitians]|nr:hypothetical protein XHV734_2978 [Xanthomonas hortorum pv. vitians]